MPQRWVSKMLKRKLQLFPAARPLDFVANNILGPFLKTKLRNYHVVIVTDCYAKLTHAVLTDRIPTTRLATIFL